MEIPPPDGVVEIPVDALVEDGRQSLVFVQPDAAKHQFTMRRVQVTHRFERTVFVRSTPIPKEEQLTARRPKRASCRKSPFGRASAFSCPGRWNSKRAVLELESRPDENRPIGRQSEAPCPTSDQSPRQKPKAGKG